jgi:hypothetical protein
MNTSQTDPEATANDATTAAASAACERHPRVRRYGPHSRIVTRGAIGDFDGNSWEAKFLKTLERKYTEEAGGSASHSLQRLIIRLSRVELRLELIERIRPHEMTDHDGREYGALLGHFKRLRADFEKIAKQAAKAQGPNLQTYLAEKYGDTEAAA